MNDDESLPNTGVRTQTPEYTTSNLSSGLDAFTSNRRASDDRSRDH